MEDIEKIQKKILKLCPQKYKPEIDTAIQTIKDLDIKMQRHLLATGLIVTQMEFDTTTIIAAILHDTDGELSSDTSVQELVKGVRVIEATTKNEDTKDEIIMKYILNNAKDLRSVIIKLASVLDKVRNPEAINEEYKKIYFRQAQAIYSEIAEYLDLGNTKKEYLQRHKQLNIPQ
jgi:GTP pyrophosphokinase